MWGYLWHTLQYATSYWWVMMNLDWYSASKNQTIFALIQIAKYCGYKSNRSPFSPWKYCSDNLYYYTGLSAINWEWNKPRLWAVWLEWEEEREKWFCYQVLCFPCILRGKRLVTCIPQHSNVLEEHQPWACSSFKYLLNNINHVWTA